MNILWKQRAAMLAALVVTGVTPFAAMADDAADVQRMVSYDINDGGIDTSSITFNGMTDDKGLNGGTKLSNVNDVVMQVETYNTSGKVNSYKSLSFKDAGLIPGNSAGTDSVAIGRNSMASGNHSVAIGGNDTASYAAKATGLNSVAIGNSSQASGKSATAVGQQAKATAEAATAFGNNSNASGKNSVAVGNNAFAYAANGTAVGQGANVAYGADNAVALGQGSYVQKTDILTADTNGVVSIGKSGTKGFTRRIINVADGVNDSDAATVGQLNTVETGLTTKLTALSGNAIQYEDSTKSSVTLGGEKGTALKNVSDMEMAYTYIDPVSRKSVTGTYTFSNAGLLPGAANTNGKYNMAIGEGAQVGIDNAKSGKTASAYNVAIGPNADIDAGVQNGVAIGMNSSISTILNNNVTDATAVGMASSISSTGGTAIGAKSSVGWKATNGTAIGAHNSVDSANSTSVGYGVQISSKADNSVAIGGAYSTDGNTQYAGTQVMSGAKNSTVIGASAYSQKANGTALGFHSIVSAENGMALGAHSQISFNADDSVALGAESYVGSGDILSTDTNGVISVGKSGSSGFTRRIINVADGVNDTDAATVGQIKKITGVDVSQGDVVQYNGSNLELGKDDSGKVKLNAADGSASMSSSEGSSVVKTDNTGASMSFDGTKDDGTAVSNSVTVNEDGISIQGDTNMNGNLNVNGSFSVNGNKIVTQDAIDTLSKDLGNLQFDNADAVNMTDAVNKNYTAAQQNAAAIKETNEFIGADANGNFASLDNGASTLAGGINSNYASIQENSRAIGQLGHSVYRLGKEVDSVGAISAALAGLHPLDYDGRAKFQIGAALGTYDGTQAVALGGFYHVNPDVLLSLGASTSLNGGDRKTAGNFGVTFRVGQGTAGYAAENNVTLQREIMEMTSSQEALRQENQAQKEQLESQQKQIDALEQIVQNLLKK